jgi:hypothetical protein
VVLLVRLHKSDLAVTDQSKYEVNRTDKLVQMYTSANINAQDNTSHLTGTEDFGSSSSDLPYCFFVSVPLTGIIKRHLMTTILCQIISTASVHSTDCNTCLYISAKPRNVGVSTEAQGENSEVQ